VPARLKWPNDVLAGEAKLGGILAEAAASADAVVIGIGINVSTGAAELPPLRHGALAATSLAVQGWERADREELLIAILACFERWYRAWSEAAGDPDSCGLRAGYVQACATLGRRVTVQMPGDQLSGGLAVGIDSDGRLLVRVSSGSEVPVAAGDVVHVR
jgi:BirA family biotin operon repressor/biotin-[acetyl-CoA-carboxylase] ligase